MFIRYKKDKKIVILGDTQMFCILILVVICLLIFVKTYLTLHLKCMYFISCKSYLNIVNLQKNDLQKKI